MNMQLIMKDLINNETVEKLHKIADSVYGDYRWLYGPQPSDKII